MWDARQYDPQIGRFLSLDPLASSGDQDRLSPYAAMGDEPAGLVDPGGMRVGPPVVSKTLLFLPDLSFMSPTMRAMAGGGELIWLPTGDAFAAFGQEGAGYYGQKILENQNETTGNNGNNSGDGSLVNNGGTSSGNSNNDGGCTSMTTDYHGGNGGGTSGSNGTGGLPWYEDWSSDKRGSNSSVDIQGGKKISLYSSEVGDDISLTAYIALHGGKAGSKDNITYFNGKLESYEHTLGPLGIKLNKNGVYGTISFLGISLGTSLMTPLPSFSIGFNQQLYNSNLSNGFELDIRPGLNMGAAAVGTIYGLVTNPVSTGSLFWSQLYNALGY